MPKQTLTFVSHTHWDREWYQPFEEYRVRLVQLVDKLLHILDTDPEYRYFMLDGQTIVLDDYLAIRPENEEKLKAYIMAGRLQIGPWHILPDEFLVAPESSIRNLQVGAQTCARFGKRMDVGNIPDPFGHISQLPQLLRGFDIDSAVFMRGVGQVPNEFTWTAPDGSDVLVIHQQNGYGNAAHMPTDPDAFIERTQKIVEDLTPTATTPHLLAMNGTDHMEPMPELSSLLAAADEALPDVDVRHGTLPQFIAAVREAEPDLTTYTGEFRDSSRFPLLPGVLSARMWIKQRNAACETLLTHWAEPLAAMVEVFDAPVPLHGQSALVKQAWRYLLQNHPHDSICGCSIDQVHREMAIRFDWIDQIGEKITSQSLDALAAMVETDKHNASSAVVVFNPTTRARTDLVTMHVPIPDDAERVELVASDGHANYGWHVVQPHIVERKREVMWSFTLEKQQFQAMVRETLPDNTLPDNIQGHSVQEVETEAQGDVLHLSVKVAQGMPPNQANIERGREDIARWIQMDEIQNVQLIIHHGMFATGSFVAQDVPGLGYRTYWVHPTSDATSLDHKRSDVSRPMPPDSIIENEHLRVEVNPQDGTFTLMDKITGTRYPGLNRFVDVGDRGDEYNYCPVEQDIEVSTSASNPVIHKVDEGPARQTLVVTMTYQVPASLGETRSMRSQEMVDLPIATRVSLSPGMRRVEVQTTVENTAKDHRLRVHFPVPVEVDSFQAEGHCDVITRSLDLPTDTEMWVEQPAPTHPQRTWSDVSDGKMGLLVANRGLPEIEVMRTESGVEVALTLLRAVGWLSRSDMSVRQGHAGPGLPTPEAQCLGTYTMDYALVPHAGGWHVAFDEAHTFNAPMRVAATRAHPGTLPPDGTFAAISPDSLVFSTLKNAEDGQGLILRLWNTSAEACEAQITLPSRFKTITQCNLAERDLASLERDAEGCVKFPVGGREVVTLRLV